MPFDLSPVLVAIVVVVVAAAAFVVWAFRSPEATNSPLVAIGIFGAFLILAAALWPLLSVLLLLAIPTAIIAVLIYLFRRRRPVV